MSKPNSKANGRYSWKTIERRVIKAFGRQGPAARFGLKTWQEQSQRAREEGPGVGKVVHRFKSPEVYDALVDYFVADIADNAAIHEAKVAKDKLKLAAVKLRAALGEHDGCLLDQEEGDRIVPERFEVVRVSESARKESLRQVIKASMKLAEEDDETLGNEGEDSKFPSALGDGILQYAKDLSEFLRATGTKGRELVVRLCQDANLAKEVRGDDDMPSPLRFLAGLVLETTANTRLPEEERTMGFRPVSQAQ